MAVVGHFYFSIFLRLTWEFLGLESERGDSVCWPNNKIIDVQTHRWNSNIKYFCFSNLNVVFSQSFSLANLSLLRIMVTFKFYIIVKLWVKIFVHIFSYVKNTLWAKIIETCHIFLKTNAQTLIDKIKSDNYLNMEDSDFYPFLQFLFTSNFFVWVVNCGNAHRVHAQYCYSYSI